jgi:NADPH:quinone reductase-like Zn-dependent oxidoreductase
MQAIVASVTGAVFAEFEQPCVIAGSVLVKVKAAALNRADLMMATGGGTWCCWWYWFATWFGVGRRSHCGW